jgi:hypothetical protein
MNTPIALLRDGQEHVKVIESGIYPAMDAQILQEGQDYIVVVPSPVNGQRGESFAVRFEDGLIVSADLISCRVGVEGWEVALRVRRESNG